MCAKPIQGNIVLIKTFLYESQIVCVLSTLTLKWSGVLSHK